MASVENSSTAEGFSGEPVQKILALLEKRLTDVFRDGSVESQLDQCVRIKGFLLDAKHGQGESRRGRSLFEVGMRGVPMQAIY